MHEWKKNTLFVLTRIQFLKVTHKKKKQAMFSFTLVLRSWLWRFMKIDNPLKRYFLYMFIKYTKNVFLVNRDNQRTVSLYNIRHLAGVILVAWFLIFLSLCIQKVIYLLFVWNNFGFYTSVYQEPQKSTTPLIWFVCVIKNNCK